jgi:drug/metabolite transporter (DMT)-like permease
MPYLILVTILWAFSFSLIGQYLAGQVDSDLAVLVRVAIAAAVFIPFTRWRGLPARCLAASGWPAPCSSASPTCASTAASPC